MWRYNQASGKLHFISGLVLLILIDSDISKKLYTSISHLKFLKPLSKKPFMIPRNYQIVTTTVQERIFIPTM